MVRAVQGQGLRHRVGGGRRLPSPVVNGRSPVGRRPPVDWRIATDGSESVELPRVERGRRLDGASGFARVTGSCRESWG
jgi:hypothetical protein